MTLFSRLMRLLPCTALLQLVEEGGEIGEGSLGGGLVQQVGVGGGLPELERPDGLSPQDIVLTIMTMIMRLLHVRAGSADLLSSSSL